MKQYTVKEKLVQYMMENGNDFTYTEMIKALLKLQYGPDFQYDWREHRGYYATNFSIRGYMTNGGGTCGVYKKENGKWAAKVYTKDEITKRKVEKLVESAYLFALRLAHRSDMTYFEKTDITERIIGTTVNKILRVK